MSILYWQTLFRSRHPRPNKPILLGGTSGIGSWLFRDAGEPGCKDLCSNKELSPRKFGGGDQFMIKHIAETFVHHLFNITGCTYSQFYSVGKRCLVIYPGWKVNLLILKREDMLSIEIQKENEILGELDTPWRWLQFNLARLILQGSLKHWFRHNCSFLHFSKRNSGFFIFFLPTIIHVNCNFFTKTHYPTKWDLYIDSMTIYL